MKTTHTEKPRDPKKNFTEYHVDLHLTPKNYNSEPESNHMNSAAAAHHMGMQNAEIMDRNMGLLPQQA